MKKEEHHLAVLGDRKLTLLVGNDVNPRKLCVFLDAEFYLNQLNAIELIEALGDLKSIRETAYVFISHVDGARRHSDYTCNKEFGSWIATDVYNWAKARYSDLCESGHVVCGLSLSGLASAHIKISYPHRFSSALCQSGSFWWHDEWLKEQISESSVDGRFWISVGNKETQAGISHPPSGLRQEVSQIDACRRFSEALKFSGGIVHFQVFDGGHEMPPWKSELQGALRWLLDEAQQGAHSLHVRAPSKARRFLSGESPDVSK